jgi:hypothetical protein
MTHSGTSSALFLLASVIAAGSLGCHSAASHQPASPMASSASAPAMSTVAAKEIHVDQSCHVLQDQVNGVTGLSLGSDGAVCHLESVHTSQHMQETTAGGTKRSSVTVAEQEYLLQNVTAEPVTFVVEQQVPKGWKVDSDPQPTEMVGTVALFRVNVEPGQIVRLHVGEQN